MREYQNMNMEFTNH